MAQTKSFLKGFAIFKLVIVIVFVLWYMLRVSDIQKESSESRLLVVQSSIKDFFVTNIAFAEASMDLMGVYIENHAKNNSKNIRSALDVFLNQKDISHVFSFNKMLWISDDEDLIASSNYIVVEKDPMFRKKLKELVVNCKSSPSEIIIGRDFEFYNGIPACLGVVDARKQYIGSVITVFDTESFADNLSNHINDADISFAIFNQQNQMLFESSDQYVSATNLSYLLSKAEHVGPVSQDPLIKLSLITSLSPFNPFKHDYAIAESVLDHKIRIMTVFNKDIIFFDLNHLLDRSMLDIGFLILMSALITLYIYSRVINPVIELAKEAKKISSENKKLYLKHYFYTELNSLADALREASQRNDLQEKNKELNFMVQKAEAANLAKVEFIRNIQHELKTPLNHIIGASEILAAEYQGPISNENHQYVDIISKAGKELLVSINNIISLANYVSEQVELKEETCNIKKIITDVHDKFLPKINLAGLKTNISVTPGLPLVIVDVMQFKEAIGLLIDNAIKFNKEKGSISVNVKSIGGDIVVAISDTGIGIEEADLDKILKMFEHSEEVLTRTHHGIGLGLTIAQKIFELHSIPFELKSSLGKGTTVKIIIPSERTSDV